MTDYSIGTTITDVFVENTAPVDPAKTGLVFAGRTLNSNNQIYVPFSSNPMPNLYVPFVLPPYKNGLDAVVALGLMGFKYTLGLAFNETFVEPDAVSVNAVSGLTTLTWNSPVMGVQYLVGASPVGSATQDTATGTIVSVSVVGNQSFMVIAPTSGSTAFLTSDPVVISAELSDPMPDPSVSDEVVVAAYAFYEQYNNSPVFNTSPNLWISTYISGRDASISPTATPITLVDPTSVQVNADGSVNLNYPIAAYQLGLLPTTALGQTTVTQATSNATGIYNGYTLTSTLCIINVVSVTGTFTDTYAVTVVLDVTQNGFDYLGNTQISSFGIGYNISNINGLQTTHSDFYNGIVALQSPDASKTNKFKVQGYYSYVAATINAIPLAQLTTPNVTYFKATAKLDIPTAVQYPCNAMMLTMASMFNDLNMGYPFYATNGQTATLWCTASTNQVTYPTQDSMNQLTSQGWTAIGINTNLQAYIYRNVCTLQSISGVIDTEYRYEELQLKVRWLNENAVIIAEATATNDDGTRKNNNPELITEMKNNIQTLLAEGYDNGNGILGNTNNTVTVTINPNDVTRLLIAITTTIVSANSGSDITVTILPYSV